MTSRNPFQRFKGTLIVLGVNLVLMGILLIGAVAGPPGQINSIAIPTSATPASEATRFHGTLVARVVYGERVLWASAIRQPCSTWSSLFSVLLGLGLLFYLEAAGREGKPPENPMKALTFYSTWYCCLLSLLGSGSMFFHAWMTDVGGIMDVFGMYAYVTFAFAYNVCRLSGADMNTWTARLGCSGSALGATLLLATAVWLGDKPGSRISVVLFTALVLLLATSEFFIFLRTNGVCRPAWWWFVLGVGAFGLGFSVWLISQTRGTFLFHPNSAFQGHAVWHVLAAVAAFFFYLYYRSETRLGLTLVPSRAPAVSRGNTPPRKPRGGTEP
jgi:hypothetical protein